MKAWRLLPWLLALVLGLSLAWFKLTQESPPHPYFKGGAVPADFVEIPLSELAAKIKPPLYFDPETNTIAVDLIAATKVGGWCIVNSIRGWIERYTVQSIRQDANGNYYEYSITEKYDRKAGAYINDGSEQWRGLGKKGDKRNIAFINPVTDKVGLEKLNVGGKIIDTIVVYKLMDGHLIGKANYSGDIPLGYTSFTINFKYVYHGAGVDREVVDFGILEP